MRTTIEQYADFQAEQQEKRKNITIYALNQRFEETHIEHNLEKDANGAYTTGTTHDLYLSFLAGFFLAEEMFYLVKKP